MNAVVIEHVPVSDLPADWQVRLHAAPASTRCSVFGVTARNCRMSPVMCAGCGHHGICPIRQRAKADRCRSTPMY
jgi:hypothetical protein